MRWTALALVSSMLGMGLASGCGRTGVTLEDDRVRGAAGTTGLGGIAGSSGRGGNEARGGGAGRGGNEARGGGAGRGGNGTGGGGNGAGGSGGTETCPVPPLREPIESLVMVPSSYEVFSGAYSIVSGDVNGDCLTDLVAISGSGHAVNVLVGTGNGAFRSVPGDSARSFSAFPAAGALGDFNRDGRLDLATVGSGEYAVTVRFGRGDGTFGTPVDYASELSAGAIAAVDLDRDENLDLVVPGSNGVGVLRGNRGGGFAWLELGGGLVGGDAVGLALNDFNHDGHWDLAFVESRRSHVRLHFGRETGAFEPELIFPAIPHPSSIAAPDLNGDGHPDLVFTSDEGGVVGRSPGHVGVLLGNGLGSFSIEPDVPTGFSPRAVAAPDLNLDGRPDLVVTLGNAGVEVFLGFGDGRFGASRALQGSASARYDQIAIDDFDLDGAPDIAVPGLNAVVVLMNR